MGRRGYLAFAIVSFSVLRSRPANDVDFHDTSPISLKRIHLECNRMSRATFVDTSDRLTTDVHALLNMFEDCYVRDAVSGLGLQLLRGR